MFNSTPKISAVLLLTFAATVPTKADVALPHIYSDHMVFQRDRPVPIRGTAAVGEKVTVTLGPSKGKQATQETTAGPDGTWSVVFPPHKAGGPYRVGINGNNAIALSDVLFGEVWVCSGQSNMAMTVEGAKDAAAEIAAAEHPQLRIFSTNFATRATPLKDVVAGKWQISSPTVAGQFSAVAYLLGRNLQRDLKVPVGIVVSAAGGTVIESWLNEAGINLAPPATDLSDARLKQLTDYPGPVADGGWQAPDFDDSTWKTMPVPGAWEQGGEGMAGMDGTVWFRREVTIPETWAGKPLALNFAPIDDGDVTYFNGVPVGAMNVDTPNVWTQPRHYTVPATAVKAGRAVIAVRITDQLGGGGFIGKPEEMSLASAEAPETQISLAGPWKYSIVERWPGTGMPSSLYNGMVAPWTSLPIAGVAWYQGESNAGNPQNYRRLLPKLINGWRAAWNQQDLPFLIVQLPEYGTDGAVPVENTWAGIREAQARVAAETPNVSLAVTLGLGEEKNIHPKDKQGVADRLTRLALANVYGRKIVANGPVVDTVAWGSTVQLRFKNTGKGLTNIGEEVKGFSIAGKDRKFVWARATRTGDTVTVQSAEVPEPAYVRYAWSNSPAATLSSTEGLPVAPFSKVKNPPVMPAISGVI